MDFANFECRKFHKEQQINRKLMNKNYAKFDFLYNAENRECVEYFLRAQRANSKNYRKA